MQLINNQPVKQCMSILKAVGKSVCTLSEQKDLSSGHWSQLVYMLAMLSIPRSQIIVIWLLGASANKYFEGAIKFLENRVCTYFCTTKECKNKCKRDFPRIFIAPLKYLLHKYRVTMLVSLNTKSDFFVRVNK